MALSIPDTFDPGLAETLGGPSARRTLARLGAANAFVEDVPGRPGHHRFAPFFRDLLRAEQAYASPATTADLERRVREWWQAQRSPAVRRLSAARPRPARDPVGADVPVESLTEKEREVLGHLAELLTTEEIAATMFISVNTVRTHVRNILRKLGVSRRNAAVRVARERDLLAG
ncbi:LuxR family transcriptional regulator [Aeromicrobium sp. IC_218]|nr:LuxR family transcriptional regulator [Aeromicrobium sp. IC_218]